MDIAKKNKALDADPLEKKLVMSAEFAVFLKETISEIKEDVKEIRQTQIAHGLEIERQKWRHGLLGLIGGALSSIGMKVSGLFP